MIRVREALRLAPFQEFELQAGAGGLENEITNVTMLDYETDARDYSAFQRGDFILSSLYFAKNDESLILEAFRALAVKGISGFAIKTVYYFTISDQLRRLAEAANIPIFTFHTTYMEDIIIAVSELKKERDQQVIYGRLLDELLSSPGDGSAVARISHQLDEGLRPFCAAAYARLLPGFEHHPLPSRDSTRFIPMDERGQHYSLFLYRGGVLLLLSCQNLPEEAAAGLALRARLEALRMTPRVCRVGLSLPAATQQGLDLCVEQSLFAARTAALWGKDALRWSELGSMQYLLPLLRSRTAMSAARHQAELLQAYDRRNSSALWDTLTAYVRSEGDFARAAQALYQHPNTVRYRIRKARQLWGDPADFDLQARLCVSLTLLEQSGEGSLL
ncbi:MAG: PucR family transcriptional regulator [Clostridia bacterium]|nr:PucR family transcriptional regulator [Clostridia bacterium]